jgi:outer membrane receptor protein involved in Fe transport
MSPRWLAHAIAFGLFAAAPVASAQDEDDAEFAELLDVLSEETEVATRTRMNSDYVPGIVTVLDARTLETLGARTVWDALSHVPGVEAWRDPAGTPTITVRGIPFPFNSGSVQVLFDSVPIAAEAAGLNGAALLLPLAQVERIEFVRGPGSVVYGDYAFQGLLNVVTRTDTGAVEVADGSHDDHWGNLRLAGAGERWHASAQVAAYDTNDAVVPTNRSADEERRYAAVNIGVGGFELVAHSVARDMQGNDAASANTLFNDCSTSAAARSKRATSMPSTKRWKCVRVCSTCPTIWGPAASASRAATTRPASTCSGPAGRARPGSPVWNTTTARSIRPSSARPRRLASRRGRRP